jgi:hypothetical protein
MWFDPFSVDIKSDSIANLANSANYQPDLTSQCLEIGEISREVIIENETPDLSQLAELAKLAAPPDNQTFVSCGKCLSFKCHNSHEQETGYCLISGDYGLWSETLHQCTKFNTRVVIQDYVIKEDVLTVTCYTPNGQSIEVAARDPEHATWLHRMNSKRI